MKPCRKCGQDKPLTDFYASAGMRDGHMNTCKVCAVETSRAWAQSNPERTRELGRGGYRRRRAARLADMDRTCELCHEAIPAERSAHAKFCSRECMLIAQEARRREKVRDARRGRMCARCGTEIAATRSTKATTCSTKCRDALNERRQMHNKCRSLSHYAVKVGRLVKQPCEVCGNEQVEIHHTDYFDPLNVRWLCFVHHRNLMHGTSIEEGANSHGTARQ
jgi:endogenous inhibitor of DNA gyrase (YacG/DUF329 family)